MFKFFGQQVRCLKTIPHPFGFRFPLFVQKLQGCKVVNLKRVDFADWWSCIWKGVRSTGLTCNFSPHDVIFTLRQLIVVSFDSCNPFGKNSRSAKFRSVLISPVQICMVVSELVLSSLGGIVNRCRQTFSMSPTSTTAQV